jgi:hypothetical protein
MNRTIVTRVGPLGATVVERRGRWRASLLGGHPSLGRVDAAIGRSAGGALANLTAAVDAALAPALHLEGTPDAVGVPADG